MKGRISVTSGLVLGTRAYRERDRLAVIYTRDFGKIRLRFIGVNRPAGKLKALSEPLVSGEYRLHIREGAEAGIAAGGALWSSYPGLRKSLDGMMRGLEIIELLDRLTPFWKPNPDKYDLAVECLSCLEETALAGNLGEQGDWVVSAFALRLLESAGFGLGERRVSEENRALWDVLHSADIQEVQGLPSDPPRRRRLEELIRQTVERSAEQPLHCAAMKEKLMGVPV